LLAELKEGKKLPSAPVASKSRKSLQAPAEAEDFKDFSKLSAQAPSKR
jgi:hypothetical protein